MVSVDDDFKPGRVPLQKNHDIEVKIQFHNEEHNKIEYFSDNVKILEPFTELPIDLKVHKWVPLQKILIFKQNFTSTETTIKNRVFFRERADLGSYSK